MSVAVRGGASVIWRKSSTTIGTLPAERPAADHAGDSVGAESLKDGEFLASVQVVRTFDKMFAPATEGEQGVLEAYLRAIHMAERFIYIENQYFNNDTITEALVAALKKKPALQLILLVNACPDMPLYMGWQQKAIKRILVPSPIGKRQEPRRRVQRLGPRVQGMLGESKPSIVDIYLHTKSALSHRWATVGSANLDGASRFLLSTARAFFDSDVRNTEANLVVFEDTGTVVSAVDSLRRGLGRPSRLLESGRPFLDDTPGKTGLRLARPAAVS